MTKSNLFWGIIEEGLPYCGQVHMAGGHSLKIDSAFVIRKDVETAWQDAIRYQKMNGGKDTPVVFRVTPTEPSWWGGCEHVEGGYRVPELTLDEIVKR